MFDRSLARELSLLCLGIIKETHDFDKEKIEIEKLLELAIESLLNHCREQLDKCEFDLEKASQHLLESELFDSDNNTFFEKIRDEIKNSFINIQSVMNKLSETLEFPKLILFSEQSELRNDVKSRVFYVMNNLYKIDSDIDNVMQDWRFKRLPRVDRDILRLAYIDIHFLDTPISVSCNEAVNLANKYSDTQGRKMINGVLRRLQSNKVV